MGHPGDLQTANAGRGTYGPEASYAQLKDLKRTSDSRHQGLSDANPIAPNLPPQVTIIQLTP